jgi:MATE family multidrug resistance protein
MPRASYLKNLLRESRRTLPLALPIVAGFLGQMLMGVTDTLMVGHVGVAPLAACSFANTLLAVPLVLGFGLLSAVSVNASHACGSGQLHLAGESLRGGIFISLVVGLLVAGGAHAGLRFLPLLGQPDEVNRLVDTYFILCAWSFVPIFVTGSAKNFCEALAHPWPPFWIMLGGVGLNVGLNWIFIFGKCGVPAMGLEGAGLATLLSRVATMVGVMLYPAMAQSLRAAWPTDWLAPGLLAETRSQLEIGIHTAGLNLSEVGSFSLGSLMVGWLGVVPLAAHQIAISCASTTFMVPLGLAQAVSVRVGHARGAKRPDEIPAIVDSTLGLTFCIMAFFAAVFLLLGEEIAREFTADGAVRALTVRLLILAGVFQIFDGIQIVSSGALRGFADTKVPFVIGVIAYWVVALPVSWFAAFPLQGGAPGIWAGYVAGLGLAAVAMWMRLHKKCRLLNVSPTFRTEG